MSIELLRAKLAVPKQSAAVFGRGTMSEESYKRMTEQVTLGREALERRKKEEQLRVLYEAKLVRDALRDKVEDTVEKFLDYGGTSLPLSELEDLSWFGYFVADYVPHPHTKENIIRWTLEALKEKEGGIREEQFVDVGYAKDKAELAEERRKRDLQIEWDEAMEKYKSLPKAERLRRVQDDTGVLERPRFLFDEPESEEEEEENELPPSSFPNERLALKIQLKVPITRKVLREAFRTVALRFHPDKNPDPGAKEKFQKAKSAYDKLLRELS